ncbi:thioredoxin-like protein [Cokeromyces recurvatus]|uniref:thioredoxin-like protein n=1 Tax=Cokeromyces recurvatus TaxID=90255 RepID=UPI00221F0650|nr:thioredoxin-like protein [Cokeromyces recurvatus]KAI7901426.1 thioredoxin-like protein [Cokeromyces recurvatus]
MEAAQVIHIKAIIDTVCPWCFIGKRRMEKAIHEFQLKNPNVTFYLHWLPYQLDPNRTQSTIKLETYRRKFGKDEFDQQIAPKVISAAESVDIKLAFGGVISNTFDSHRLIWWSKQFDKQNDMVERIFELYFEQNLDLSNHELLAAAAEKAGLVKEKAFEFLQSDEGTKEVKELLQLNAFNQVNGVPHYIINDKYGVSGAQEPATLIHVFERIIKLESAGL